MKKAIGVPDLPTVGPYSPAIRAGDFLFISGQIPMDAAGKLVPGGIEEQARRAMENLKRVLDAAGASLKDLVKVTIYLVDMGDFAVVNKVYGSYFDLDPPARACVAVKELPKGARVEIEAVAYLAEES